MTLRDWLHPATLATPATLPPPNPPTVATVATVARVTADGTHFAWAVQTPDGWREVRFVPPANRARVALHYPGCLAAPLPAT